jgi:hypothetical protein
MFYARSQAPIKIDAACSGTPTLACQNNIKSTSVKSSCLVNLVLQDEGNEGQSFSETHVVGQNSAGWSLGLAPEKPENSESYFYGSPGAGLPDFSWYNIPKRGKIYRITTKYIKCP